MSDPRPASISAITPRLVAITWSDGPTFHYPADLVRAHCPCAHCTHGLEGAAPLARGNFSDVAFEAANQVGQYALRFRFSDGHHLGLYSFAKLRVIGIPPGG